MKKSEISPGMLHETGIETNLFPRTQWSCTRSICYLS